MKNTQEIINFHSARDRESSTGEALQRTQESKSFVWQSTHGQAEVELMQALL